ncbi:MAG: ABC transporter substrate-binding protein, partial [Anaerolineaceae bacterium]
MFATQKRLAFLVMLLVITVSLFGCSPSATATQTGEEAAAPVAEETAAAAEETAATEAAPVETGEPKVVTVAMTSAWDSMMPLNTNSNYSVFVYDQIYDRLAQGNAQGTYDPRLADSWEVNEESTAVTFHLNPNATWHDGQPVTADDVVFTFQMYSDPEVSALSRYYLSPIAGTDDSGAELSADSIGVSKVDDHTVVINMKSAMFSGNLFNNLNSVYIIPKHIFESK